MKAKQDNETFEFEVDILKLTIRIWHIRYRLIAIAVSAGLLVAGLSLFLPKKYQAEASFEISNYLFGDKTIYVDNPSRVKQWIKARFVEVGKKSDKNIEGEAVITTVTENDGFLFITAKASTTEASEKIISKVIDTLNETHSLILDEEKRKRNVKIQDIERSIKTLENQIIPLTKAKVDFTEVNVLGEHKKKMNLLKQREDLYTHQLNRLESTNIKEMSETQRILNVLQRKAIEDSLTESQVEQVNVQIESNRIQSEVIPNLKNELIDLQVNKLSALLDTKSTLDASLAEHNFNKTQVVGGIISTGKPVSPRPLLWGCVSAIVAAIISSGMIVVIDVFRYINQKDKYGIE